MALVADRRDPDAGEHEILAVGRLSILRGREEAEFALLVRDGYQGRGLGTELLRRLIGIGRDERLRRITADILKENRPMQQICRQLGFRLHQEEDDPTLVRAEIDLATTS